jgi:hypothetical protein
VNKVLHSNILAQAKLFGVLGKEDLNQLVDDVMAKDSLKAVPAITWNHGKVLAVNGKSLMTGGMNFFGEYTSQSYHDICDHSVKITGDAAVSAHKWADYFWRYAITATRENCCLPIFKISRESLRDGQVFAVSHGRFVD